MGTPLSGKPSSCPCWKKWAGQSRELCIEWGPCTHLHENARAYLDQLWHPVTYLKPHKGSLLSGSQLLLLVTWSHMHNRILTWLVDSAVPDSGLWPDLDSWLLFQCFLCLPATDLGLALTLLLICAPAAQLFPTSACLTSCQLACCIVFSSASVRGSPTHISYIVTVQVPVTV